MNSLNKKLWRTVLSTKGQFLAVAAVVMLGMTVFIAMVTTYHNLEATQDKYYKDNNFADHYFHVINAPQEIVSRIEDLPGVLKVTGRIQKDVPVLKEDNQRATARLTGYWLPIENEINGIEITSGQIFDEHGHGGKYEVLLDPQYAEANKLSFNDTLTIAAEGKQVTLTVAGTAIGPEFVYPIKDASTLIPDYETFGIFYVPNALAQQFLNLPGQINQILIIFAPGADKDATVRQIENILEPYGNLTNYPRDDQISHALLQAELDQLLTTSQSLPVIFLLVAALIQFVIISRLVKSQRLQIGIMKALGYHNRQIMWHYAGYAMLVAVTGLVLGSVLGVVLAGYLTRVYALYFNLPEAMGGISMPAIVLGAFLCMGTAMAAGFVATRGILKINAAHAMRPEPPKGTGKVIFENWPWFWRRLDPSWKMALRGVLRNRLRFAITTLGVVLAVGLLVVSWFFNDSIDYLLEQHFYREQKYDLIVRFDAPVKDNELLYISQLDGVIKTEPIFEMPVKMAFGDKTADDTLLGLPTDVSLKMLVGEQGQQLWLPTNGILMDRRTAHDLGVNIGDKVKVETQLGIGPSHQDYLTVMGINRQFVGGGSYINISQLNRLIGEHQVVTGAMLKVEHGKALPVEEQLNKIIGVSSVLSRQKELDNFYQHLEMMVYFTGVMVIFAGVLGFAIVYNSSLINFYERKNELASLKVIGFSNREISNLLLKETAIQTVLGIALGLPFGRAMAHGYINAVSTDMFIIPVIIYPMTYILSAIGGIIFVMVAFKYANRGIRKLDMVEALKYRD
ncbi:ABC transporter permease [Desulfofalx alkaliphila]|uniref:ABC transporter permease n=1 Tax=Desulfofalx alkaliphila TaxID=105483 RepID=UPI0004E0D7BD|nr:ABC transporter permease [Desulfofalx alkaliphila]